MKIMRLTWIDAPMEMPDRTLPTHDEFGRRCGIQEFIAPVFAKASSQCPVCVLDTPHAHTIEELKEIRAIDDYLSDRLEVPRRQSREPTGEKS